MRGYGFSLTHILPYKDKIEDFVFIRENTGQWETRISRMFYALSTSIFNVWRSLNFSFNFNFPRFFALSFTLIHFVRRFISIYHFAFLLLIYIYIYLVRQLCLHSLQVSMSPFWFIPFCFFDCFLLGFLLPK